MSQHDYIIADASGSAFLADLNLAVKALAENNYGTTEPAVMYAHMWWADTTADILKKRNAANTGWISYLTLSTGAPLVTSGTWSGGVTGSAIVSGAITSSSPTSGIGYATGAGGTVIQITSKTTAVTLEKKCGTVTTHNAALPGGASVKFTINRTTSGFEHATVTLAAAFIDNYSIKVSGVYLGGVDVVLKNETAGSLSDAVVFGINFTNWVIS